MKRPIGLAIAFTAALSLMTHETEGVLQAQPSTAPIGPQLQQPSVQPPLQPQQRLDGPHRIASLIPGVERLLEASAGE